MSEDLIFQAAELSGFTRTRSCCGVEGKTCRTDEWQGDLKDFVRALLSIQKGRMVVVKDYTGIVNPQGPFPGKIKRQEDQERL